MKDFCGNPAHRPGTVSLTRISECSASVKDLQNVVGMQILPDIGIKGKMGSNVQSRHQ